MTKPALIIDTSTPVIVTGATGYVAGWIVKALLDAGVHVHAPVRAPDQPEKIAHLVALAKAAPGEITFFKADLLAEGSYAEAMAGCGTVFHTASPFLSAVNDPQTELVDPALLGTKNVLNQANQTPSVKRVVLTSSVVAMYGYNAEIADFPGGKLSETAWNTTSSLTENAYSYSKTLAEQEAWKIAKAQNAASADQTRDNWDLVVINPSLVLGPALTPKPTSDSFHIVKQFGDGTLKTGAPRYCFGAVDVRDLAAAHLAAAFVPAAHGRNIISGHSTNLFDLGQCLVEKFGKEYPIPRMVLPKWLVWLIGPITNKTLTRKSVSKNVDVPMLADTSKGITELGVTYRPLQETMIDMFTQLVEAGTFKK